MPGSISAGSISVAIASLEPTWALIDELLELLRAEQRRLEDERLAEVRRLEDERLAAIRRLEDERLAKAARAAKRNSKAKHYATPDWDPGVAPEPEELFSVSPTPEQEAFLATLEQAQLGVGPGLRRPAPRRGLPPLCSHNLARPTPIRDIPRAQHPAGQTAQAHLAASAPAPRGPRVPERGRPSQHASQARRSLPRRVQHFRATTPRPQIPRPAAPLRRYAQAAHHVAHLLRRQHAHPPPLRLRPPGRPKLRGHRLRRCGAPRDRRRTS